MMSNKLPIKQKNGFFYKIFIKIKKLFKRNKYVLENKETEKVAADLDNQFKNNIKVDGDEFDNEYKKKKFMENLKNNQEMLENFSNERLRIILKYYLDENEKKREILKNMSN